MSDQPINLGVRIRGFVPTDLEQLSVAAKEDEHLVLAPTHVLEKDGKLVGFLSIAAIPTVFVWMHSKQTGPKDAICVQNFLDNVMFQNNYVYMVPCKQDSPFYSVMEKLGYAFSFIGGIFFKSLTKG